MKHKVKGFTLVELLVAITVSTLLMASISAAFIMISNSNQVVLNDASTAIRLYAVKSYIVEHYEEFGTDLENIDQDHDAGMIYYLDGETKVRICDDLADKEFDIVINNSETIQNDTQTATTCTISYGDTTANLDEVYYFVIKIN